MKSSLGSSKLPLQGCLVKSLTPHSLRKMIGPGLFSFLDAEVVLQFASTSRSTVSLHAVPPAVLDPIRSSTKGRHMVEAEAAVTFVGHCLYEDSVADPTDLYVGRLQEPVCPRFL